MSKAKDLLNLTGRLKLEDKAALLRERFQDKPDFTISDAASVLQEKQSTLYWTLHKLTQGGYISRTGQGLYSFQNRGAESIQPILSTLASRILNVLGETGHDFFISGLDILTVFMDHVPETYPVLLFAGKSDVEEVADILSRNKIDVVPYANIKDYSAHPANVLRRRACPADPHAGICLCSQWPGHLLKRLLSISITKSAGETIPFRFKSWSGFTST